MNRVVIFGSGHVARPAIRALLDRGHRVRVATDQPEIAAAMVDGHPHGEITRVDATDPASLSEQLRDAQLAISLLPVSFHVGVARACLEARIPFVTTSYVSDEMRALHAEAADRGLLLLNEVGADPGIDHMLAMRILDGLRSEGATITGVFSVCGGLPAPEANDNPLGYKISWSPRGVALAGKRPARHLRDGAVVDCAPYEIFQNPRTLELEGLGSFEAYPNGDSLRYLEPYGLEGLQRMFRGTLRYAGWCETWAALASLGQLEDRPVRAGTYADAFLEMLGADASGSPRAVAAARLGLSPEHPVLDRMEWLGLFDAQPVESESPTSLDLLVARMAERLRYAPGERDMLLLYHEVDAVDADGRPRRTRARLVAYGIPDGDSAMARTVGLPAAIAAHCILDGTIAAQGVQIPNRAGIYGPILAELAKLGIEEERSDFAAPA